LLKLTANAIIGTQNPIASKKFKKNLRNSKVTRLFVT